VAVRSKKLWFSITLVAAFAVAGTLAIVGTAPFGAVSYATIEAEAEATDGDGWINTPLPDSPGDELSDLFEKLRRDPPSGVRITQTPPGQPGQILTLIIGTPDPGEDRSTFDAIQQLIDEASP
jgi:hypothetical protein